MGTQDPSRLAQTYRLQRIKCRKFCHTLSLGRSDLLGTKTNRHSLGICQASQIHAGRSSTRESDRQGSLSSLMNALLAHHQDMARHQYS